LYHAIRSDRLISDILALGSIKKKRNYKIVFDITCEYIVMIYDTTLVIINIFHNS